MSHRTSSSKSFLRAAILVLLPLYSWTPIFSESVDFALVRREVVEERLAKYAGNNKQREATLRQMFSDAGCDDQHLSEQSVNGSRQPNVICSLPGSSDRVIIVAAHYDRVSEGDGVVDNWSGASLLPSLYEAVKAQPRKHTYVFIGFTDEERGLVGSRFYVRQMTKEQVVATDAMVNMDTLGIAPSEVWASHSDKRLLSSLIYIAKSLNLPLTGVNAEQIGSTDSEPFAERKIPRITIHSLTQAAWNAGLLHSSKDRISAIHRDDYYETCHLLAAYIALLDQTLTPPQL
jgi:putative aminopeptidase FrvX